MIISDDIAAALLAPIDDSETGVGVDGRVVEDEGLAEQFRELRSQRKAIFRSEQRAAMGEDSGDSDTWTWPELAEHATDYLTGVGKDLEPMAMLVEAAVRIDGLAGFDRTVNVMADLIAAFWDQGLFPAEDEEDGVEARFQPISGMSGGSGDKDGTLVMPLRRMLLAGNSGTGELRYIDRVAIDTIFANAQTAAPEKRPDLNKEGETALEEAEAIARRIGVKPLKQAIANLESAEAGWRRSVDFIVGKCKPLMPAASRVTDELRKMREWLSGFVRKMPDEAADEVADDAAVMGGGDVVAVAGGATAANAPFSIGTISRRDDALRAVTAAAEYFEKMEPLSPLGATLREVDRRARLSLDALLTELIPDSGVRETYYWRSGIKPPA